MARYDQELWSPSDQGSQSTDTVPRWLTVCGLSAALALTLLLLRYAIDLLGLVFVIVVVGFAIRALTDWLTDGESVSFWSIAAVCIGLAGTILVGTWLFGSRAIQSGRVDLPLPTFVGETISWAESKGWGHRVLLAGLDEQPAGREPRIPGQVRPLDRDRTEGNEGVARFRRDAGSHPDATGTSATRTPDPTDSSTSQSRLLTSTTLSVTPGAASPGRPVRLMAVVQTDDADTETPEGTVVFWRDGVVLGSATLRTDGDQAVAQLTTRDLPAGQVGLSAEYVGTNRFRTSRSPVVSHLVSER